MYWLARPPFVRYAVAAAVVLAAVVWDLWPEATVRHPFAAMRIPTGAQVADSVVWRAVPDGVLPEVDPTGVAVVDIEEGEPILPSLLGASPVPDGWWVVALDVPAEARLGAEVRVAVTSPAAAEATLVRGIVVAGNRDVVGGAGAVAVPEADAGRVAAAAAGGRASVLVGSG